MDSKVSRSKFEPREKSSEIRLLLQAFKFASDQEVNCLVIIYTCLVKIITPPPLFQEMK